jgi:hypothetical protein
MKILIRFWKKFLYILITGSTSVFIACCYGPPVGWANLGHWTIKTKNKDNKPIYGLEITVLQYVGETVTPDTLDTQITDSTGTSTFSLETYNKNAAHRHEAAIRDIDGADNGGQFADTLITKSTSDESTVVLKIQQ